MAQTQTHDDLREIMDRFLAECSNRTLIPAGEVQDFVLDLRNVLKARRS